MLRKFQITEGKVVPSSTDPSQVLLYVNPDELEKKYLIEELKIDEYDVNSALDPNELGRVEFENGHTIFILKRPKKYSSEDNFLLKISSIGIFLFPDKLIILLNEDTELFDGRYFSRLRSVPDLLLKIIYRCILHFVQHLQVIQQMSDELEGEINKAMSNRHLLSMFNLEKSLVYYLKSIGSNGKVIDKIRTNAVKFNFSTEEMEFLEDLAIENSQCNEQANTYSQVLSNMMDAWASVVSNNLNILIKKLTLLTIGIMLPTLVVSIFSMNVRLPANLEKSPYAFWWVIFLAILSAVIMNIIQRLKNW